MIRISLIVVILLALAFVPLSCRSTKIKVGSKKFTESVVLGEMLKLLSEDAGVSATHYQELGGTKLVFDSLINGDIDIYPEYTGTIAKELFSKENIDSENSMREVLRSKNIIMSRPLGFNNTYILGMLKPRAKALGIKKTSDLLRHPDLKFGFSNEFMARADGWPNLKKHYNLPQKKVTGLEHAVAYKQLELKAIDVIDVYRTDAKIKLYDLALLEDDLGFFRRYEAVLLYRADLAKRYPEVEKSILRLEGRFSEEKMMDANTDVELAQFSRPRVAADFLKSELGVVIEIKEPSVAENIAQRTIEHLDLVRKSLIPAILLAIPLGIFADRFPRFGQIILALVGIVQTIPSLALLVILMPLMAYFDLASVGLGSATAVTALLLYSLLPIVRNTHAGLVGIANEHREAAAALGLPAMFRLLHIELPLASGSILSGIKTAAVINIGFATLGALIGAGGYGQPIITGMNLNNTNLILQGAIPAAVLALVVQGGFELSERYLVPRGLRLDRAS